MGHGSARRAVQRRPDRPRGRAPRDPNRPRSTPDSRGPAAGPLVASQRSTVSRVPSGDPTLLSARSNAPRAASVSPRGVGRSGDAGIGRRIPDRPKGVLARRPASGGVPRGTPVRPPGWTPIANKTPHRTWSRGWFIGGRRSLNSIPAVVTCRVSGSILAACGDHAVFPLTR